MKGIKKILVTPPVVVFLVLVYSQPAFAPPPGTETSPPGTYPPTPPPDKTPKPPLEPSRTLPDDKGLPQEGKPAPDVTLPLNIDAPLPMNWRRFGDTVILNVPAGFVIRITNVRGNVTVLAPDGTTAKMPDPPWIIQSPKATIIIAEDVEGEPLTTLVWNKLRGTLIYPPYVRKPEGGLLGPQTQGDARYRPAEPDVPPKIVQQPNGDVVMRTRKGEWTLKPDGTVVQRSRDGTTITFDPNGTVIEVSPDGGRKVTMTGSGTPGNLQFSVDLSPPPPPPFIAADGTRIDYPGDGRSIVSSPDGSKIVVDRFGRVTEKSGKVKSGRVGGTSTDYILPNGAGVEVDDRGGFDIYDSKGNLIGFAF